MYGVNAGVPKTLVRHHRALRGRRPAEDEALRAVLLDILDTPVSPELLPADANGEIAQQTEDARRPVRAARLLTSTTCCASASARRRCYRLARHAPRRPVPGPCAAALAEELLPPLLRPAVQAQLPARRAEGRLGHAQPPRRLAHAQRRLRRRVAGRARPAGIKITQPCTIPVRGFLRSFALFKKNLHFTILT